MKSYFEIGGHIVECERTGLTSLPSSKSMVPAAERPERGRISAKDQASSMPQTSSVASVSDGDPFRSILGQGMIRTGVAILMVPDPVPFADEIVGAALIGVGAALVWSAE